MSQGMHLSQRMALSQVLAPQLQQSLALLQAPTLELRALVEQEMEQNPVLEEMTEMDTDAKESRLKDEDGNSPSDPCEPPDDVKVDPTREDGNEPVDDFQAEFEKLVQLDQEWRDHFSQSNAPNRNSAEDEEKREFVMNSIVATTSLQEHLIDQLRMAEAPKDLMQIAQLVIGNIDDRGYLQISPEDLAFSTGIPVDRIVQAVKLVQSFEPAGVGTRDLRECLMLQLERDGKEKSHEYRIIADYMEALGKRRIPEIARGLGISNEEAQDAVNRVALLEPHPGRAFLPDNHQYIVPEVFVHRIGEEYIVSTNNDQVPHLRISNSYKDLMAQPESSSEVREYIREKIRAGKFLIKSLHQRQQTILNIANEIVKRQREFLDKGIAHLKPMTMVQVAEAVGVHETTVSRAVSGKYMETPQGVFEMKYFFTSGIMTADGVGMSNTSVKDMIADLVKTEPGNAPFSDDQIVKMLKEKNIVIARRTVAKYRAELNILPSNLRRKY
jgi:RNA polymerase sigma-54 factor